MKITRTTESFYPVITGPANQAARISEELEKRGVRSPILTSDYGAKNLPKTQKFGRTKVMRFRTWLKFLKYRVTPGMKAQLKDFDILHAHNCRSYQTAVGFSAARRLGRPFVITLHGGLLTYRHLLKGLSKMPYIVYDLFSGRRIVKEADAVIVNSKKEYRDAISYGISRRKLHIIPVGIDIDKYRPMKKDGKKIVVLSVGRISWNRNIDPIIRAAAILKKTHKNLRFIIVGGEAKSSDTSKGGYLDEMKRLAERLDVTDTVEFTGEKKDEELRNYYRTADIFVYTSLSENFGQPILEAGAAGLPIICTDVGVAPEIIRHGKNGFIVKSDPKEIAKRITDLKNRSKRQLFGNLTRDIIAERFDWKNIIDDYVRIYTELLKKKKKD